jgi:hypothetical protein
MRYLVGLAIAASVTAPNVASAKDASMTSQTLAEELFQEAKQALSEGRASEACPKLADSHRLDPAGGTVLLLGLCLEQQGNLASAWSAFNDALGYAERDGRADRRDRAREHLKAIEPRLPKMWLELPTSIPDGFRLDLDGTELPSSAWQTAVPLDPGPHEITASAPLHMAKVITFTASESLETRVLVPALARPADAREPVPRKTQRDIGLTTLILGGAVLVAGVIAGITALRWDAVADSACPQTTCTDPNATAMSRQAAGAAHAANWTLGIGAVLGAGGAALFWTAPALPDAPATGRAAQVTFSGAF